MRHIIYLLFSLFLLVSFTGFSQKKKIVVAMDAGHGGSDPGHLPNNSNLLPEKDLNLAIANLVAEYIDKYLSHVEVVYTRKDDRFVSLDDRVDLANERGVDYFISIHCNANDRAAVHGTETHVHDLKSVKSVRLATIMEKEFANRAKRKSRGIKDTKDREHSLQVLKYTEMTSVLIECGFLTNEREAGYLNTVNGQEILASAIFRGFRTFITNEHPNINFLEPEPEANFSIQIMSSKNPLETDGSAFKHLKYDVERQQISSTNAYKYRYLVGSFTTREEAKETLEYLQKHRFKDAIIISIKN